MFRRRGFKRLRGLKDLLSLVLIVAGAALLVTVMPSWFWLFFLGVGLIVGGLILNRK